MSTSDISRVHPDLILEDNDKNTIRNAFERIQHLEEILSGNVNNFNAPGLLPIGCIAPWHKTLTGVPQTLDDNWLECNGQVVDDKNSLLDGQTLEDLNGDARFLRGGSTSGTEQADAFQGHYHNLRINNTAGAGFGVEWAANSYADATTGSAISNNTKVMAPITDGVNDTPRIADETRPINMNVVWIIRIK